MDFFWNLPDSNQIALIEKRNEYTYSDLKELVKKQKKNIEKLIGSSKKLIAVELSLTVDSICTYLAALSTNHAVLISEPGTMEKGNKVYDYWNPDLVIKYENESGTANLISNSSTTKKDIDQNVKLLMSTSGSTGDPKLVMLSSENIQSNAKSIAAYLSVTEEDKAISSLPLFYSYGLSVLHSYLQANASFVLTSSSIADDSYWDIVDKEKITSMALVPHQFEILKNLNIDFSLYENLRYVTQAGGKLSEDKIQYFNTLFKKNNIELFVMYGQTEASPRISYIPPNDLENNEDSIGIPIPGGELSLIDDDGKIIIEENVSGELVYKGPNVMLNYAQNFEDLKNFEKTSLLKTGDIAIRKNNGFYKIVGRSKRFVKIYGKRINLDQVENYLKNEGFKCNVTSTGELIAIVRYEDSSNESEIVAEKFGILTDRILEIKIDKTPLLPSGKIDYKRLKEIADENARTVAEENSNKLINLNFIEFIKKVTKKNNIDLTKSFRRNGGDSLAYLEIQLYLEKNLETVPEKWDEVPLVSLQQQIANDKIETSQKKSNKSPLSLSVILRVLAITMIVAQHATSYPLYGGTWILLILMGASFVSYQRVLFEEGNASQILKSNLIPIIPMYFGMVIIYNALRDEVPWQFYLLIGNYRLPEGGWLLGPLWYVSLFFQIVLFVALLSKINIARYFIKNNVWNSLIVTAVFFLILNIILRMTIYSNEEIPYYTSRGFIECFQFFILGALIKEANNFKKIFLSIIVSLAILTTVTTYPGVKGTFEISMSYKILISVLLLSFIQYIYVPKTISLWAVKLSSVTLYVYLTHQIIVTFFAYSGIIVLPEYLAMIMSIIFSFAFALVVKWIYDNMFISKVVPIFQKKAVMK